MHDGKWWYKYDANGNRTIKAAAAQHEGNTVTINTTTEYWEYEWDYHNRLIKVQQFNAPDNASNVCVEYTYDALNRRIERKEYRTYYKGDIDDKKEDSPTSTHPSSTSKNPEIKYDGSRSGEKPRTEKKHY